ncbi:hypothetical protein SAMN05216339_101217 [Nitrosomonas eutropha]|uniref:Uncharacterized protein n=1 Tax=Nitrosomonas eutropha TaxID=916 RepID=A0A1I7F131_9PROT|nr:hypothetical protein [Nitrosomonas eutropha]SFU29809.1 hypothetical protein SAMN05216339_101217 [Nitrosomonas eutropha]
MTIGADQLIVKIVAIRPYAVSGQIALGVMREGGPCCCGVLVEAVGGVALGAVGITRPLVQIIGPALACDFLRLVTGVAVGLILRGPCQVVSEAGKCTLGAVGIAGGSTVTQRYRGTTAEVIPGVSGQVYGAGFLDRRWAIQCIECGRDVERGLRPTESRKIEDKPRFSRACRYSRGNPKSWSIPFL